MSLAVMGMGLRFHYGEKPLLPRYAKSLNLGKTCCGPEILPEALANSTIRLWLEDAGQLPCHAGQFGNGSSDLKEERKL